MQKSLSIEVVFQYRIASGGAESKPLWLDIDGCGDSEYTTPVGYNDATVDWASNVSGRMIGMSRPPARRGHHQPVAVPRTTVPTLGHGIAVSAELVGGNSNDYFGPIPPNNPPPASLTGATLCRSEGYYGTAWAGTRYPRPPRHDELSAGSPARRDSDRAGRGLARRTANTRPRAIRSASGQTIRLHSEYQNNNTQPQTDVMGIMMAWYVPPSPGYPRPKGATPTRVPLVPAYNAVHEPQPGARAARLPGQRLEPGRVVQPAGPDLEPAHDRHAGRERRASELDRLREGRRAHRATRRHRPTRPTRASRCR